MCFHRGLVLSNVFFFFFLNRFVTPKRGNPIRRISVPIFQMAWLGWPHQPGKHKEANSTSEEKVCFLMNNEMGNVSILLGAL